MTSTAASTATEDPEGRKRARDENGGGGGDAQKKQHGDEDKEEEEEEDEDDEDEDDEDKKKCSACERTISMDDEPCVVCESCDTWYCNEEDAGDFRVVRCCATIRGNICLECKEFECNDCSELGIYTCDKCDKSYCREDGYFKQGKDRVLRCGNCR